MGNSVAVLLLPYLHSKNDHNKMWFDAVIAKIKGCNFLPHSGLSLELMGYLSSTDFLPSLSDILQAVDRGDTAVLILLDLLVAYDMVNHAILLQRLQTTFGIDDSAHRWFQFCQAGISMYAAGLRDQPPVTSSAVCLRVLCWDQFCLSCTPWS